VQVPDILTAVKASDNSRIAFWDVVIAGQEFRWGAIKGREPRSEGVFMVAGEINE
jgi:hypothetical protein